MVFNFPAFSIAFIVGALLALFFAFITWSRRQAPGAVPFTFLLLAIFIWSLARALEAGAIDFGDKVFWGKTEFLGALSTGVIWLCFTQDYVGSRRWRNPRNLFLLFLFPIISFIAIWTNEWHHLFWTSISPSPGTSNVILIWKHGIWFWIAGAYQYAMIISGIILLMRFLLHNPGIYRKQIASLIVGILIPLSGNGAYLLGLSPIVGLDLTPFAFVITGGIFAVTIFRFRLLDIVPVARGTMFENLPDGILVLNKDDYIADINPAAERMIGVKVGTAIGKTLTKIWPKLDVIFPNLDPGKHTELLADGVRPPLYLDISITPLESKHRTNAGKLVVLRDTTDRRKIEQTLRESESRYEALIEQSNEGVLIILDGKYKFANRTMCDITGYSNDELVGKLVPFTTADEDWEMVRERYWLRTEGKSVPNVYECRLKHKSGKIIDAEMSVGMIIYEGQTAQMVTMRDISERKMTQRKIEALYNEEKLLRRSLQEEMDKRSKYTRALVHELRTPLTSILASGELLEIEIKEKLLLALVKNIRRASLNLEQRINELIELARGEIGMLKINSGPLDITELVRDIVSEMTPVAQGKQLLMISEIEELPLVQGDRTRLRQVLTNLLGNAIKFTNKGMVKVIAKKNDSESVLIQVQDTGRGIEESQLENLFDPYRRKVNEGQDLSGLGIGLALSKMFIDLHQGKIWVESQPQVGSTFSFTIPIFKESKTQVTPGADIP